jgi:hypothetical protein
MKFNNYHYSHNGQATIYRQLFAETRAFLRGERQWFANTRAWLQGIGALFANTRAMLFYLFSFGQRGRMPFANLCASLGNKEMDAGMPTSLQFTPAPTISLAAGSVTVNIHTSIPPAGGDSVKTSRIK